MRRDNEDVIDGAVPVIVLGIVAVFGLLGIVWLVQGNEFFLAKVFAPRMEEIRRQTFEESKAYNEGNAQDLRRMQLEYVQAKPEQQAALAAIILHQTADTDIRKLPRDLQDFVIELQHAQGIQ